MIEVKAISHYESDHDNTTITDSDIYDVLS